MAFVACTSLMLLATCVCAVVFDGRRSFNHEAATAWHTCNSSLGCLFHLAAVSFDERIVHGSQACIQGAKFQLFSSLNSAFVRRPGATTKHTYSTFCCRCAVFVIAPASPNFLKLKQARPVVTLSARTTRPSARLSMPPGRTHQKQKMPLHTN